MMTDIDLFPTNHKEISGISSIEAFERLQNDSHAVLLDVRTEEEWKYIGLPNLENINKKLVAISWLIPPFGINQNFLVEIEEHVNKNQDVYILCRSGGRSLQAAQFLQQLGYNTFNVNDGMEGSSQGKGWKENNLPWSFKQ